MRPTRSDDEPDDQEQEAGEGDEPDGVVAALTGADTSTPYNIAQFPSPYDVPEGVTSPLSSQEREHLDVCERALHAFRLSTIVAGKALDVISRGRLYRETHGTFVEYLDDVWEIRKSHAYRMIEAWPVAAAVSPIGDINEGQARELVTVAKTHDLPTAVAVYQGVKELRGERKVAAADLAEARSVLPSARALSGPDQVPDVLRAAATEGRALRLAPPAPAVPKQQETDDGEADRDGQDELHEGAEAIATMEAALAQQKQIYDRIGGGLLSPRPSRTTRTAENTSGTNYGSTRTAPPTAHGETWTARSRIRRPALRPCLGNRSGRGRLGDGPRARCGRTDAAGHLRAAPLGDRAERDRPGRNQEPYPAGTLASRRSRS